MRTYRVYASYVLYRTYRTYMLYGALTSFALATSAGCAHGRADHLALGQASFARGDYAPASAELRAALAVDPHDLAAMRALVECEHRRGELPALLAEAAARASTHPDDPYAHELAGLALFAHGGEDLARAEGELAAAARLAPDVADLQYRLGLALFQAERFADARAPLARAVELAPKVPRYRPPLALCLDRLGDKHAALAALAPIPHLKPAADELALALKAGRVVTDPFRGFATRAPGSDEDLQTGLAWMSRADAPVEAIKSFDKILARYPDLGVVHALVGLCYARIDEAGHAVSSLEKAEALDPDAPQAYVYLGDVYFLKQRPDQAREQYEKAVERDPLSTPPRRRLADLAVQRGDWATVVDELEAVRTLTPDDDEARLLLVDAYRKKGDDDAAEAELSGLEARAPKSVDVLMRLAALWTDRRERTRDPAERRRATEAALRFAERALDQAPENEPASRLVAALKASP